MASLCHRELSCGLATQPNSDGIMAPCFSLPAHVLNKESVSLVSQSHKTRHKEEQEAWLVCCPGTSEFRVPIIIMQINLISLTSVFV